MGRLRVLLAVLLFSAVATVARAQFPVPGPTVVGNLGSAGCPAGCAIISTRGYGTVAVQVTGTWSGTLTIEGSIDGVTYQALNVTATNGTSAVTTTTANGVWTGAVGGLVEARVRMSVWNSGTAVVSLQVALSGGGGGGGGGGGAASSVTINDPTVTTQKAAVNASGQLSITCANCSGSGASAVDNSAFTAGATSGAPAMGFYHSTIDAVTDGDTAAVAMTAQRGLHVNPRTDTGVSMVGTGGSTTSLRVTGANDGLFRATQIQQTQQTGGSLQAAATANGNGSAITTQGYATVLLEIQCTACAGGTTINFEGGTGNLNFSPIWGSQIGTNTIGTTTTLAGNSMWQFDVAGVTQLRARISNYSAGTVTVDYMMLAMPHTTSVVNANAGTGTFTVGQGTGTNLHMVCDDGCLPVVTAASPFTEGSVFNFGSQVITPAGYVVDEVATNTVAENTAGAPRMNTNRIAYADLSKSASNTNSFKVDFGGAAQPVSGTFWQATQPVSGTVTANAGTGNFTVVQGTGTNLHMVCDSGCSAAGSFADNAAFTFGTTPITNAGYVVDDTSTNTVTENSAGTPRMSPSRIAYADISKSPSNTNSFKVDFGGSGQPVTIATLPALTAGSAVIGHVIVDTTSTTAVTQATGTNLHAVIDSGSITTVPPANASTNVAQLAGTATSVNSGVKDAGTLRVVLATDQPALTNKLLVTPDSVALPANQSVNVSQINAVTPLMGNGITGTGSQRVTIASDNTAFAVNNTQQGTAAQNVTQFGGTNVSTGTGAGGAGIPRVTISNDSSLAANQSVNAAQINGVAPLMGNGVTGTGSQRVTIASDNTAFSVNANAGTNLNTSALALSATQTDRTQKTQLTDGTRDGTVKAASTLPLLTDTAVVVTQRDPLPAGTNAIGHIVCDSGCGSPAATADGTAFTAGVTNVSPLAAVYNDSIASLTTGTYGAPRLTANRALQINLRDSFGLELGVRTNPTIVADVSTQQQLTLIQKQGLRLAGTFGRAISSSGDALDVNLRYADPCGSANKGSVAISQAASTRILPAQNRRLFICSVLVVGADAENLSIVEGTGSVCATGTLAVIGGTTAALGTNMAANGGWSLAGGGSAIAMADGLDLCLLQSGSGRVSGVLTYALAN